MAKKVSSNTHRSLTRERVMHNDSKSPTSRSVRRAEQRKAERALRKAVAAARVKANPRLVRM